MRWPFRWIAARMEAAPPPATQARASGVDWAALPPIRRAAGDIELTAESRRFARGRAGRQPPELVLQPLGHERSLTAPAGLVAGFATVVHEGWRHAGMGLLRGRPAPVAVHSVAMDSAPPPEGDEAPADAVDAARRFLEGAGTQEELDHARSAAVRTARVARSASPGIDARRAEREPRRDRACGNRRGNANAVGRRPGQGRLRPHVDRRARPRLFVAATPQGR